MSERRKEELVKTSEIQSLLEEKGELFSEELGIDVENEPFKWLIASVLFGGRVSVSIAKNTYKEYEKRDLTSPQSIDSALHGRLVKAHGDGGYTRYDGITADYMKAIADKIIRDYDGDVSQLDKESESPEDLEDRIQRFQGIGPVTARIFLRELRGVWENANPDLTDIEIEAAKDLNIVSDGANPTERVKDFWEKNEVDGYDFRNLQAALVRHGIEIRRSGS